MHVIALTLTLLLTEGETHPATPNGWLVNPSSSQVDLFTALEWTGLAVVSLVGIVWLTALSRSARRAPQAPAPTSGWRVPIRPLDT